MHEFTFFYRRPNRDYLGEITVMDTSEYAAKNKAAKILNKTFGTAWEWFASAV